MRKAKPGYTVHELCRVFQTRASTYYYQCREKSINHEERIMMAAVKTIAVETNYSYGKRRIHASLLNQGFKLGIFRTKTLMKKANVFAITPRKRHYYPSTGKPHIKAENILARRFYPKTINTHWVGDNLCSHASRLELLGLCA